MGKGVGGGGVLPDISLGEMCTFPSLPPPPTPLSIHPSLHSDISNSHSFPLMVDSHVYYMHTVTAQWFCNTHQLQHLPSATGGSHKQNRTPLIQLKRSARNLQEFMMAPLEINALQWHLMVLKLAERKTKESL